MQKVEENGQQVEKTEVLNQHQRIINYINENGFIDRISALLDCGIFELSARITELEKTGVQFKKVRKAGKSRKYGTSFTYVEYSFAEGLEEKQSA